MPVSVPAVSGITCAANLLPQNRVSSDFLITGGPRVPALGVWQRYPVVYVAGDDQTYSYMLDIYPKFEGQLFWSNTIGTSESSTATKGGARLFIAMTNDDRTILDPFGTVATLIWVPVVPTVADVVLNADTGKPMDYLGEYTCNPPWLCRG